MVARNASARTATQVFARMADTSGGRAKTVVEASANINDINIHAENAMAASKSAAVGTRTK